MNTVKEFTEALVDVTFQEDKNEYGHYPFQMIVLTKNDKAEVNSLMVDGVVPCYLRAKKYVENGCKKLFMSIDFPAGGDIHDDFVGIFSIEDRVVDIQALPYDRATGEKKDIINSSSLLNAIKSQLQAVIDHKGSAIKLKPI